MRLSKLFFITFVGVFLWGIVSTGLEAEETASQIIKRADAPFLSHRMYSLSKMILYRSGRPWRVMELETYSMSKGDNYYSLVIYKKPPRLKGTAYLVINDDLWVRFASTGRVRKLSSSARENSAGGSDFSYSDMGESGKGMLSKYTATLESSNSNINGISAYKIALAPRGGVKSYYERLVVFIDKSNFHYLKIDYYRSGANVKSLIFSDYRSVGGNDYPFKMTMENHVRPTKTEIITEKIELNSSRVNDSIFTVSYLRRIR